MGFTLYCNKTQSIGLLNKPHPNAHSQKGHHSGFIQILYNQLTKRCNIWNKGKSKHMFIQMCNVWATFAEGLPKSDT